MEISKEKQGGTLRLKPLGELDSFTAPELVKAAGDLADVSALVLDLEKVDYISSAGIRVILSFKKTMEAKGTYTLEHVGPAVREVLDMTGASEILGI